MTENEAIFKLKRPPYEVWQYGMADLGWNNAVEFAISSLEEIKQYRAIGTVDEIQKMKKEEDILKFYYCESEDEYYIGKRIDTMYYAKYSKTGFTWCMSRYLPWGKHVVEPNTLWKEHTYPSEPKEIPFFEWLQGFIKKECLGTVEECRDARERQRKKKPVEYEDKYFGCPNCNNLLMHKWDKYPSQLKDWKNGLPYCLGCGQAISWERDNNTIDDVSVMCREGK